MEILFAIGVIGLIIVLIRSGSNESSNSYKLGRGLGAKVKKIMDEGKDK